MPWTPTLPHRPWAMPWAMGCPGDWRKVWLINYPCRSSADRKLGVGQDHHRVLGMSACPGARPGAVSPRLENGPRRSLAERWPDPPRTNGPIAPGRTRFRCDRNSGNGVLRSPKEFGTLPIQEGGGRREGVAKSSDSNVHLCNRCNRVDVNTKSK